MPTIEGKSITQAQEICAQWNLGFAVMEERYEWRKEEGTVLCQWPKPGDETVEGATAVAVVSKRPEMVRMPNLHKLTMAQAEQRLNGVGLRLFPRVTYRFNEAIARDLVMDFDPGRKVYAGSEVEVVVSRGPVPTGSGDMNTMRLKD